VVTGYLILDDSTPVKRYAQKMGGQGWHNSSTDRRTMPGHSLFEGLYLVEGRQYPLDPQLYIQQTVCEQQGLPFRSKVDLAAAALDVISRAIMGQAFAPKVGQGIAAKLGQTSSPKMGQL
jgi:hypothetical protein